jgi:hypothetical protein
MNGVVPFLHLYNFKAWTGTTWTLHDPILLEMICSPTWFQNNLLGPHTSPVWLSARIVTGPDCFLGAFTKMRKETIGFIMSVRPSICLQGTPLLPLDGFSWNFIFEYFSKLWRKVKFYENLTRIAGTLHEGHYTFLIIYCSIPLKMRNVSGQSCRENQNMHFMFNNSPPPNHSIYEDNVEKYCRARQATDNNIGAYTLHAGFLILQIHTQNM